MLEQPIQTPPSIHDQIDINTVVDHSTEYPAGLEKG